MSIRCTIYDIRKFLLCQPRAAHVRVIVEGKMLYVAVKGQTWSRVAETLVALAPERIDIMAAVGVGTANDGMVLRSGEVEIPKTGQTTKRKVRELEERLRRLEALSRKREQRVVAVVDSRTHVLMSEVRGARRELERAETRFKNRVKKLDLSMFGPEPSAEHDAIGECMVRGSTPRKKP